MIPRSFFFVRQSPYGDCRIITDKNYSYSRSDVQCAHFFAATGTSLRQ